ncbi:hypothetical protein NIES21_35550 [Anabaenopsis circularis NIES-21]|uniref:Uncharacterized protein n=1 Tax=Anabaenopsis circularis NIES-21 TaxID=1085406 RepID=A0A1Z4GJM7_9CYAN|nr:hypothetical protein NIES21_35550 [Anabaenopsis circularis NIES-21]
MPSHQRLFTELTPQVAASICGGLNTKDEPDKRLTKSLIRRGRARIRYYVGEKLPDQNISTEDGECRPYFNHFTGQFTFSCVLRDPGIFGDKMFPDL